MPEESRSSPLPDTVPKYTSWISIAIQFPKNLLFFQRSVIKVVETDGAKIRQFNEKVCSIQQQQLLMMVIFQDKVHQSRLK